MLNNLVNLDDLTDLFKKIRQNPHIVSRLFRSLKQSKHERTKTAWAYTYNPQQDWFAIPAVLKRWNELISGDPDVDYRHYVAQKYLSSASSLSALSLGCGNGSNEIVWAKLGIFQRIDAYDISSLHLLLYEIVHNFCSDDPDTQRWLKLCFAIEDQLIAEGDLTSDFIVAVCQKRCEERQKESEKSRREEE